jgi:hypothetical protein
MKKSKGQPRVKSWFQSLLRPFCEYFKREAIAFRGMFHSRTTNILLFPYPDCRIDHLEIQVNKLHARLYQNFLVVDGQFSLKAYFLTTDDLIRLEQMLGDFLTTQELPGLLPKMQIEFGEIKTDYFFTPLTKEVGQTTFQNEVVMEIPYIITENPWKQ